MKKCNFGLLFINDACMKTGRLSNMYEVFVIAGV